MERHPKFTRLHQSTTPSVQFSHASSAGVEWPQPESPYIQPSQQWSSSSRKENQLFAESHQSKTKESSHLKSPYYHNRDDWPTNSEFGDSSVNFGHDADYSKNSDSPYAGHHVEYQPQSWPSVQSEKVYRGDTLEVPDLNHGHSRLKSRHDEWMAKDYRTEYGPERSEINTYQSYPVSPRDVYSVKDAQGNSNMSVTGINQLDNFYSDQLYVGASQDFVDTLTQPSFAERPDSRGSIPQSPVETQAFHYSQQAPHYPVQPVVSPGSSQSPSQLSFDAAKLGSRAQATPGLAPALIKLYEKYGIAALKLIYLQRTRDLAVSQHRQWNNSPHTISQHFKDLAPVSPNPMQARSPLPGPSHRIQIQGGSIQHHEPNTMNTMSQDTIRGLQSQSVQGIENSSTSGFRSIEFNQTWPLQSHQASNLSPMTSPMPPTGQHYHNDSPFQPEMAQHQVYIQPADNTISQAPTPADFYQDNHYPKTPEIHVSHSSLQTNVKHYQDEDQINMSPYQESTEKLQPQPAEAPTPSGTLPTTFGLSAMRSHPEYDSFLPPRKKSRYAFEAAERLLASFGKAVSSRVKSKEVEPTDNSSSNLNGPVAYHDKLKAFSIHNQSSGDNNDLNLNDQLTGEAAGHDSQLQIERAENNGAIATTADIGCFQKEESNYAENDPISMKELQSALLDFDANPQVGDDLFDFDKNDELPCDSVENQKAESQSPVKKDSRYTGKGLGKHSKGISSKPRGKDVPTKYQGSKVQPSEPVRGRKPASKYTMGGIVCPRKAITKAWAYRQAKKNLELIPRRILRPRKPKKDCLCSTTDSSLKVHKGIAGKLSRLPQRKFRVISHAVRKSPAGRYYTHVRENQQNVSMEFSVRRDQKRKLQQVRQKLDALRINPSPLELSQLESDLRLLENLNQQLEFGDKFLMLANIVGKEQLNDLTIKLLAHQNVVLSPKVHGGVKDILCPTRSIRKQSSSSCFCKKPWRLPPADENNKKSMNVTNCRCDDGHSFVIYEYNDQAPLPLKPNARKKLSKSTKSEEAVERHSNVTPVSEQSERAGKSVFKLPPSVLQGSKLTKGRGSIEVILDENNGVVQEDTTGTATKEPSSSALPDLLMETPHVNPQQGQQLESSQHEHMNSELSIRDIPFYKSTLPKKRGKLWHVTSLALSAARAEAEKMENNVTNSSADFDLQPADDRQELSSSRNSENIAVEQSTINNDIQSPDSRSEMVMTHMALITDDQVDCSTNKEAGTSPDLPVDMFDTKSSVMIPHLSSVASSTAQCSVDILPDATMMLSYPESSTEVAMVIEVANDTPADNVDKTTCTDDRPFIPSLATSHLPVNEFSASSSEINSKLFETIETAACLNRSSTSKISKENHVNSQKQLQTELKKPRAIGKDKACNGQGEQKKPWLTSAIKQCPQCSYTTRVKSHLNRHMKTHDVQSQLACPHCTKTFCERPRLDAHILANHTESGAHFECSQCQKVYNSREGLRVHVKRDHQGQHKYVCGICQKGFQQIHQYEGHVNKHSGSHPFQCHTCGKGFRFRNNRNSHEKTCAGPSRKD